jgi:hypothetical protein
LAPEKLSIGNLTVNFRKYPIEKIAFWSHKEGDGQHFFPGELKGFGFEGFGPQLAIELTLTTPYAPSGFIKKENLKEQTSLNS